MVAVLVCLGALAVAWPLATGSFSSAAGGSRRADARRLRHVERHPREVTTADVARLLRLHELPDEEVRFVLAKAEELGVGAFTLWMWIKRFDVHALAVVLGADLSHTELLRHLADGSLPDLAELEVFAVLNGLPHTRHAPATTEASDSSGAPVQLQHDLRLQLGGAPLRTRVSGQPGVYVAIDPVPDAPLVAPPVPPVLPPRATPAHEAAADAPRPSQQPPAAAPAPRRTPGSGLRIEGPGSWPYAA